MLAILLIEIGINSVIDQYLEQTYAVSYFTQ